MLDQRKLKILKLIIDDFIDSGQPVGSRTIAKNPALGVSPATVRNEMADLEELGYLTQPHTSAGRIPSDLGYRLYVETLEQERSITQKQRELIRNLLLRGKIKPEEVIRNAARLMAEMTGMVVAGTLPGFKKHALANLKMIRISDSKVLMILVSDSEVVKSIMLPFAGTNQVLLDKISDSLFRNLYGSTIEDIDIRKISRLKFEMREYEKVIDYLVPVLRDTLSNIDDVEYVVEGYENILNVPEFADVEKARRIYRMFDDQSVLARLFAESPRDALAIRIGEENGLEELRDCTVIHMAYRFRSTELGQFAVVGPRRMDYRRVISVADHINNTLSDIFSGIYL